VNIRTTTSNGLYVTVTGTSLAAPHVAGGLALLLSAFPSASIAQQETALVSGAHELGAPGPDNTYGFGRLDLLGAYDWLAANVVPVAPPQKSYLPYVAGRPPFEVHLPYMRTR
jgi:subtilisin family serine protease